MFSLVFKYKLLESLRQKEVVFWNILFPLIMATLFFLTIGRLDTADRLEPIPVAVTGTFAQEVLPRIEMENGEKLFDIRTPADPEQALLDGEISGIVGGDWRMDLTIAKDDLNTSVLRTMTASMRHKGDLVEAVMQQNPSQETLDKAMTRISQSENHIVPADNNMERNISNAYYYALLGMVCLAPSVLGVALVEEIHPQSEFLSSRRVSVAPVSRFRYLMAGSASQWVLSLVVAGFVILYMSTALGVDFGGQWGLVAASMVTGITIGLLFGMFLGLWIPGSGPMKIGVSVAAYIGSSFFAGMMSQDVRFLVENKAPWFAAVNPGSIVTRMFYSLYYYQTTEHWILQWRTAMIAIAVLLILVFIRARRVAR